MRYWQLNWKLPEKNVAGFMNPAWLLSLTWSDYDTFKSITDTETSLTSEDVIDVMKPDVMTRSVNVNSTPAIRNNDKARPFYTWYYLLSISCYVYNKIKN